MAAGLEVRFDPSQFGRLAALIRGAGKQAPIGLARALNYTGDRAKTPMTRQLTIQTGLSRRVIVKALRVKRATPGRLAWSADTAGGDIHLRYFKARETQKGVSAAPWGRRQIYGGTFIKGGRFPNRVALNMGGQVFVRRGRGRFPLEKPRSGLFIPAEMVKGETAAAFYQAADTVLPGRLAHELERMLALGR
jgi:hypothetical protein